MQGTLLTQGLLIVPVLQTGDNEKVFSWFAVGSTVSY